MRNKNKKTKILLRFLSQIFAMQIHILSGNPRVESGLFICLLGVIIVIIEVISQASLNLTFYHNFNNRQITQKPTKS